MEKSISLSARALLPTERERTQARSHHGVAIRGYHDVGFHGLFWKNRKFPGEPTATRYRFLFEHSHFRCGQPEWRGPHLVTR